MSFELPSSPQANILEEVTIRNNSLTLSQQQKLLVVVQIQSQSDEPLDAAAKKTIAARLLGPQLKGLTADQQEALIKRRVGSMANQIHDILGRLKWSLNNPTVENPKLNSLMTEAQKRLGQDFTLTTLVDLLEHIYINQPKTNGSVSHVISTSGVNTNLGGFRPRPGWVPREVLPRPASSKPYLSPEETRIWIAHFNPNPDQTNFAFLTIPEIENHLIGHKFDQLKGMEFHLAVRAEQDRLRDLKVSTADIIINLHQIDDPTQNISYFRSWLDGFKFYQGLNGSRLLQVANRLIAFDQLEA